MTELNVNLDGVGNAGIQTARALAKLIWPTGCPPCLRLCDDGRWAERHAAAGVVDASQVGRLKAASVAEELQASGWPAHCLAVHAADVRDRPRCAYYRSITVAATDSHALKYESVLKSLQAESPAIAIGLGRGVATVECFAPGGPGYCCIHADEPEWSRRHPCLPPTRVSATAIAWLTSPGTVRQAGVLVAQIIADFVNNGAFPGGTGFLLQTDAVEPFSFDVNASCVGPHDGPFHPGNANVIRVGGAAQYLRVHQLLAAAGGATACYADREVAWGWDCGSCGTRTRRLHVAHPAARCAACGTEMKAGWERASGLTAAELEELHGGPLTLHEIGMKDETLVRCSGADRELVWLHLENCREPTDRE